MTLDFDIIIVGSGPSGVSAAFPLLEAGLRVLLLDGGNRPRTMPPAQEFLTARASDIHQHTWMVGNDFHALKMKETVSPKLRVPTHDYVFDQFTVENRIQPHEFVSIGSLAKGGLSNTWGCGVARLSESELKSLPFPAQQLDGPYATVASRMGISGAADDDLSDYYGLDQWAQPPVQMDSIHSSIFHKYKKHQSRLNQEGFRLGRSRVAVITEDFGDRQACDLSGTCLWGCARRSLFSSVDQLPLLREYPHYQEISGGLVQQITSGDECVTVSGKNIQSSQSFSVTARKVILAAGSLASTRLVLQALQHPDPVPVLSAPTAAFLIWFPRFLGRARTPVFGLGQLSFSLAVSEKYHIFGSTFSTQGIPVSEFVSHLPLRRKNGIRLLSRLLSSCIVGNLFLSEDLFSGTARLAPDGTLSIQKADPREQTAEIMQTVGSRLRNYYFRLGGIMLPGSFTVGKPGGDIHYAGTLPMKADPRRGETSPQGEVAGLAGVHVVDGASFPILTEKSPTLTLMANADRIARHVAAELQSISIRQ